jgi:hypothetical protein
MRSAISPPAAGNVALGAEAILSCIAHLRRAFDSLPLLPLVLPLEMPQTCKNYVARVLMLVAADSSAEEHVQLGSEEHVAGLISGPSAAFQDGDGWQKLPRSSTYGAGPCRSLAAQGS